MNLSKIKITKMKTPHWCVVKKTANQNHVSYQGVNPNGVLKTERFGCVFIQEPNEVSRDFISTPVSILIKYHQPKTDRISGQFKLTTIRNFVYVNNTLVFSITV